MGCIRWRREEWRIRRISQPAGCSEQECAYIPTHFYTKMPKRIFLIPGFKSHIVSKQYGWLVSYLKDKGYDVISVPIKWNYRTLTQNAQEFIEFYKRNKTSNDYVLGFSFGAVIALMTAETISPKKLFLCSLSPDFKEDSKYMSHWLRKYIGEHRYADTTTRSAIKLSKALSIKTVILYGENEGDEFPQLKRRCEETAFLARDARLVIVPNAPHDISAPMYQSALKKLL